jgi:2-desacetyl-2-hydroxyethyl bacteriochlorophyllide A dehydrogenase
MIEAARLVSPAAGEMVLEPFTLPEAAPPGGILVRAEATAISSGTEIANYLGRTIQRGPDSTERYLPGYSFAGTVLASDVARFRAGDRVCGPLPHASHAAEARPERLARMTTIPDGVEAADAALTQLCCIVINAVRIARIELGERVAVVGAGLVGLLACRFARLAGGRGLTVVEPLAARRELAERYGRARALAAAEPELELDVVFEASGAPAAVPVAFGLARKGGRVVLLGSTRGLVDGFDPYGDVHVKGLTVLGAHVSTTPVAASPRERWTEAANRELILRLLGDGELDVAPLITDRVAPHEGPDAFRTLAEAPSAHLGVLIDWSAA